MSTLKRGYNQNFNGLNPLNYIGVNSQNPPEIVIRSVAPTPNDSKNFYIGDIWVVPGSATSGTEQVWMLVDLEGDVANWIMFAAGSGSIQTLTGNSGGAVMPLAGNINVLGDTTTINIVGNPATHTLTVSAIGTGVISTLTGNSGGAVSPLAGNINVVGDATTITIVGNPGTHTLTASTAGHVATSYVTDAGTAVPAAGVLDIKTQALCGSSVEFTGSGNLVALAVTDANDNTLVGLNSGNGSLTGTDNTGLGFNAGNALTSGAQNVLIGFDAGQILTTGSNSVLIGFAAGSGITTGANNIHIGSDAGTNLNVGTEHDNLVIGTNNLGVAGETGTVRIGSFTGSTNTSNTFVGYKSGNNTYTLASAIDNTCVGALTGNALTTGTLNVIIGSDAGQDLTTGFANTAVGTQALNSQTSGDNNVAIGNQAGFALNKVGANTAFGNVMVGSGAGNDFTTASENTSIGYLAQQFGTTGILNCSLGFAALRNLSTGSYNVCVGAGDQTHFAGTPAGYNYNGAESYNVIVGSNGGIAGETGTIRIGWNDASVTASNTNCTYVGFQSGNLAATRASSTSNTAVGALTLAALTTGNNNLILGSTAGTAITTGSSNSFIGNGSGSTLTTGSRNSSLGSTSASSLATTDHDNICINNTGTGGDTNIMRIGAGTGTGNFQLAKTFISGIRGVTTDANDAIAVLVSSTGQLGTVSSSARFKDNIQDMGSDSSPLINLRPVTFTYKTDQNNNKQYGLIAEEVKEIMPRLVVHNEYGEVESVKYHELPALLLNEIIKLNKRIEQLEAKLN